MIFHRLETFLHIVAITHLGGKGGKGDHSSVKMEMYLFTIYGPMLKLAQFFLNFLELFSLKDLKTLKYLNII